MADPSGGRYGSGSEGFDETRRKFQQQGSLRDELKRKTTDLAKSEEDLASTEADAAKLRSQIASEAEAVASREAQAVELQSRGRAADTGVVDANTAARRRSIAAMTEEEALLRRHQALQGGLQQTRAQYGRTVAQEGIGGTQSAALAAQEAEIRRRMGLIENEMQYRGMSPPPTTPYLAREDPNAMRQITAGTSTIVSGAGGAERIQESAVPTGRADATRRLNAEIQANVVATKEQQAAVAAEAVAERESAAAQASVAGNIQRSVAIEGERRAATRASAVEYAALDTSMYRHGALTTEFISAAARGEVTLRDLATQVGQTTAKFAGWTAAAGLVYGAYKAIKDFGEGAIQTQNAVTNLSRFITTGFDTSRAREQLQSLARETNVPIQEVGDAASQFARVFHNQDQAFAAARASIILTKLDNLSTADSYRALTASIQGFHLEAKDIPGLMDSINASQREFGANVSQITAGIGRSAGSQYIANPGKNPVDTAQFTQALIATMVRTTGGQGANIGIALGRAATRFSQQPANVATLAGYGIDASKGFDSIITQAMQQIQKRNLPNQDVNKISQAIGGPSFGARYFAGLLENGQLFNKILADTSPEKAKGTAQEELQKKLSSFSEQLKSVGVNLQVMGSQMEQAGVFEPLHLGVVALSDMLRLSSGLLGVFNQIPAPLRDALIVITAITAASRLMTRFGGASGIVSKIPGLGGLANEDVTFRRRTIAGLRTQQQAAYGSAEQFAKGGIQANIEAEGAAIRTTDFQRANAAALAGQKGEEAQVVAENRLAELEAERAAAIRRGNTAAANVISAQKVALAADEEIANVQKLRASEVRGYAERNNIPVVGGFKRPTAGGVEHPGGQINPATGEYMPPVAGGATAALDEPGSPVAGDAAGRARQVITREAEGMRGAISKMLAQYSAGLTMYSESGPVARAGQAGLRTAEAAAGRGIAVAEAIGAGAVALGARISALMMTNVTLLGTLAGGFLAYTLLAPAFKGAADKMERSTSGLNSMQDNAARLSHASDSVSQNYSPVTAVGLALTDPAASYRYSSEAFWDKPQAESNAYALRMAITTQQSIARQHGTPIPNQTADQIKQSAQREFDNYKQGRLTLRDLQADFAKHAVEIRASLFITTPAEAHDAQQAIAQLAAQATGSTGQSYEQQLGKLDSKHLTALTTATLRDLKAFGTATTAGRTALSQLGSQLGRAEDIALNTGNQGDVNAFAQAQEQITGAIQQQVQNDLQISLSLATNEQQRQAAYRQAISSSHAALTGPDTEVSKSRAALGGAQAGLEGARRRLAAAQASRPRLQGGLAAGMGAFGPGASLSGDSGPMDSPGADKAAVDAYTQQVKTYRDRLKKAQQYREQALRQYQAAVEQLKEQSAQDYAAGLDAAGAVREAGMSSKADVIADQIRIAGQKVAYDIKHFGQNNRLTEQAIANQQQLISQGAAQGLQDQQLRGQLSASKLPSSDSVGRAQAAHTSAVNDLAYVNAHKRAYGPDFWQAHEQALIAVNDTANALSDAVQSDRQQMIQVQGEIAQARDNGNAVAQARDAQNTARNLLAAARTPQQHAQAVLAMIQADNQAKQAGQDQIAARFEYLESLTTDPLKIDQLQIKAAQAAVRGTQGAARWRALAGVNKAKQQYVADRISGRESDVQFQLDMGNITSQQAEQDLQALLKVRGITKQQKQELQLKIHQLQTAAEGEASGFGLDVGSIKMPTVYDVRRAMGGVRDSIAAARSGVTPVVANNTTTINVDVKDAKAAPRVYEAIDKAAKTHLRATMRTVKMRHG